MSDAGKYRFRVEQGGAPRRVYGARQQVLRDGHTLAVQVLTDVKATVPPGAQHWAFEVRRGRMTVYGGVLRFLDVLHRKGVPMETALLIPRWLEEYVRQLYDSRPGESAQPMKVERAA